MLHGSACLEMITQQWPKGPQGSLGVTQNRDFSANPCRPDNGKVLTGGAPQGASNCAVHI